MFFFQRVHTLPEAFVLPCLQLSFVSESLHRFQFPLRIIAADVVEDFRLQHEEGAVNPVVRLLGFFMEARYRCAGQFDTPKASRRMHSGDGCQSTVLTMKSQQRVEINIGHTVAPGQHECVAANERLQSLDSTSGGSFFTRVDEVNAPV